MLKRAKRRRHRLLPLLLQAMLVGDLLAQAHSAPVTPPPGARTRNCKNRIIPQLIDITAQREFGSSISPHPKRSTSSSP